MRSYQDGDVVVGYSGFILYEECYEYNENACYIAATEQLAKAFMERCGHAAGEFRVDGVSFGDVMKDYGASLGEYAMEGGVFSKFVAVAESNGVRYSAEDFIGDSALKVVKVEGVDSAGWEE